MPTKDRQVQSNFGWKGGWKDNDRSKSFVAKSAFRPDLRDRARESRPAEYSKVTCVPHAGMPSRDIMGPGAGQECLLSPDPSSQPPSHHKICFTPIHNMATLFPREDEPLMASSLGNRNNLA
ncbi:hypothetical protein ACRALDRAFT_210479 [Sodiomyces alcalophilus JCM 7366]|uniref:uncharacterized protein n=1 Tax=Sodiomyces alcalophilus JCM 7366 TaxID=591952 RepID=UPI0039B627F4